MIGIYYCRDHGANSFFGINEKNESFLVDASFSENGGLIDHIKKININLVAILLTHGHWDHISSLEEICKLFPDVRVYISEDEAEFLENTDLNLSKAAHDEGYPVPIVSYLPKNLIKVYDGDIIKEAGFEIKVILTPFHTRGSACYYVASENALFSGDTLFFSTIGRTDLPTGSNKTLESSLGKLKALPDGIKVYPGHGACTKLDREKKYNTYLKNI